MARVLRPRWLWSFLNSGAISAKVLPISGMISTGSKPKPLLPRRSVAISTCTRPTAISGSGSLGWRTPTRVLTMAAWRLACGARFSSRQVTLLASLFS